MPTSYAASYNAEQLLLEIAQQTSIVREARDKLHQLNNRYASLLASEYLSNKHPWIGKVVRRTELVKYGTREEYDITMRGIVKIATVGMVKMGEYHPAPGEIYVESTSGNMAYRLGTQMAVNNKTDLGWELDL
jgi:hypothetical protein